jgi:hypothetical protein
MNCKSFVVAFKTLGKLFKYCIEQIECEGNVQQEKGEKRYQTPSKC